MLGGIGYQELLLIAVVAVLLFGKRLPEVARTVGSSYQQFRKGLHEMTSSIKLDEFDDPNDASNSSTSFSSDVDDYDETPAPRFDKPPVDDE